MKKILAVLGLVLLTLGCGGGNEEVQPPETPDLSEITPVVSSTIFDLTELAQVFYSFAINPGGIQSQALTAQQAGGCPESVSFNFNGDCNQGDCEVYLAADYGDGCYEDGVFKAGFVSIYIDISPSSITGVLTMNNFREGNETTTGEVSASIEMTDTGGTISMNVDVSGVNENGNYSAEFEGSVEIDNRGTPEDDTDDSAVLNGGGTFSSDDGTLNLSISEVTVDRSVCELNPISGSVNVSGEGANGDTFDLIFTFHEECDGKVEVSGRVNGTNVSGTFPLK